MLGGHALPSQPSGPPALARRKAAWLLAAALTLAAGVIWSAPARADHDDDYEDEFYEDGDHFEHDRIYCRAHRSHYGPAHFRRHPDGYVVLARGGYHFYPNPHYAALVSGYAGRPAVFVSGGYFYPLWIGYGPVFEPGGYFEIHGGRFGRTHLGLRIGLNALPTVGYGFLAYPAPVVRYAPRPRWFYYRGHSGPPHVVNLPRHPHGRAHRHPRHSAVWKFD